MVLVYTPPPLFDLKLLYSYVIEVADSESDLGLHGKALVSEIFTFYHLLKYARGRPGRRGHVHHGKKIFFNVLKVIRVYEGYEGFEGFWVFLRVLSVWRFWRFLYGSNKLCCSNQDQIRTQRLGLFRNTVILGRKPGGCKLVSTIFTLKIERGL